MRMLLTHFRISLYIASFLQILHFIINVSLIFFYFKPLKCNIKINQLDRCIIIRKNIDKRINSYNIKL